MTKKFERVLSDDVVLALAERSFSFDVEAHHKEIEWFAERLEQAVLAKIAEQEPVAWRVHPFDYGVGVEGAYAITQQEDQMQAWIRKGWDVTPLYAHHMPSSQVNLDSLSVPTEEKTVEQHRAEFEAWVASEFKGGVLHKEMIARYAGNNDLYHHAQTTQLWRAWKAARGVEQ